MKAHIRRFPTKNSYVNTLEKVATELSKVSISGDILEKLTMKISSDEYFEKMKRELGGVKDEE